MDWEYCLMIVPFLTFIIQIKEEFDCTFVYRNTRDLYIVSNYKAVDYITVYIVHSYNDNSENTLQTKVIYERVKPFTLNNTD